MFTDGRTAYPLLRGLVDFVFPPLCSGCGKYCEQQSQVCGECVGRLQTHDFPFCLTCGRMLGDVPACEVCGDGAFLLFSFGNYVDPLKELIANFKFNNVTRPAAFVAERLADKFGEGIRMMGADALVPIPLHRSREFARGYNQAELFALELSRRLDIPMDTGLILRKKKRREQARLRDFERQRNIAGVFEAVADAEAGESVILVDDVVTGGYTVKEAKRELEQAGFRIPAAISMAHGL